MRTLLKTLCVTLALPAGAFALGQDVDINETNFPDQIFRGWLLDKGNLNGMGADGVLTSGELAQITVLDLSGLGIGDLTGISHFTALERLNVNNNRLTSLDVSKNTRLTSLYCATNALGHLDVTGCPELVDLNCERNRLTELNLACNPKLVQLYCRHNSLTQLDVSRNLELVFIETFDNSLTSFDCSMLKKLEFLHIDYNKLTTLDMSGNPALKDSGFVAANNHLDTLVLPNIPDFTVDAEVFYEQNPAPATTPGVVSGFLLHPPGAPGGPAARQRPDRLCPVGAQPLHRVLPGQRRPGQHGASVLCLRRVLCPDPQRLHPHRPHLRPLVHIQRRRGRPRL